MNNQTSLQTHSFSTILRTVLCRQQDGSAVVEAAIGVPIFLCGLAIFLIMGQMIFTQAQIYYALSQTTQMYAQIESTKKQEIIAQTAEVYTLFYSYLGETQIYSTCLEGGKHGILLQTKQEENEVSIHASYYLKVPIPYFKSLGFLQTKECSQRIFSGYILHEQKEEQEDPIVYLAKNATVYHTTMSCTHISIKISDPNTIHGILGTGSREPCKKCVSPGVDYATIYLTAQGDSYHSTLSCSALKRTIRAVRLSEAGGIRACSRCGGK